jgi:membrane protein CcdC involved in cytochrome C biogenesis
MYAEIAMHYKFNNLAVSRKNSRKKGMVFKPSFKCLKNKKINLSPAFLKLETLLFQNMFLLFHLILYSQSDFDLKKKKKWSKRKKNMPYIIHLNVQHLNN